jgi:hypothetical protein
MNGGRKTLETQSANGDIQCKTLIDLSALPLGFSQTFPFFFESAVAKQEVAQCHAFPRDGVPARIDQSRTRWVHHGRSARDTYALRICKALYVTHM